MLFLLRKNHQYGYNVQTAKSGLLNSATMTAREIEKYSHGHIDTKVLVLQDSNSIDKAVYDNMPNVVVLEALWVLPSKLRELQKLHPHVEWIIRVHSEIPFLANEGEAINTITGYAVIPNVKIAFNSLATYNNFLAIYGKRSPFIYLPNVYEHVPNESISFLEEFRYRRTSGFPFFTHRKTLNIGAFGAIRPMKNQLLQAFAAVHFGNKNNITIRFHINASRLEQGGDSVYKNIKALFNSNPKHELIEHGWMDRPQFLSLVASMDLGLQLSFNESFNIVAADFVKEATPIVVSSAINWMNDEAKIDTEETALIVRKMEQAFTFSSYYVKKARKALHKYNHEAIDQWLKTF